MLAYSFRAVVYADGFDVVWIKGTLKGSHFSRATLRLKIIEFYLAIPTLGFSSNSIPSIA